MRHMLLKRKSEVPGVKDAVVKLVVKRPAVS
jgi:hypothetical protein